MISKINLYPHQKKFTEQNPDKALICFEVGTGKTFTAVEWLRSRDQNALIIVPKRIKKKWQKDLSDVKGNVVTKEEFKKLNLDSFGQPSALIIDEAHFANSGLFIRGRSQISTRIYEFIKKYPDMPVVLLTATPISSSPWNLHTLLCYIGIYYDWKKWREKFFELKKMPYLPYPAWLPKKTWRKDIQEYLKKHAHMARLSDCVEYLPPITEEVVKVQSEPFIINPEWEPMAAFVAEHRNEQLNKPSVIREIGEKYRKMVVVAHFREQIEILEKELSKDKQVYTLHGGTKDPEEVIRQAQEDDECFIILQASVGVGFDLDSFDVMLFASQGYSYVSFIQMKGRIRRIHNLKPVKYYYLHAGRCDKMIYKQLGLGKDFDPSQFNVYETP